MKFHNGEPVLDHSAILSYVRALQAVNRAQRNVESIERTFPKIRQYAKETIESDIGRLLQKCDELRAMAELL
jgi:hypothetical protein